jgi:hypothetical protein
MGENMNKTYSSATPVNKSQKRTIETKEITIHETQLHFGSSVSMPEMLEVLTREEQKRLHDSLWKSKTAEQF